MYAVIGALLFFMISILTLLVAFGLPLGEFTMGGQNKILPSKMRVAAGISFFIQLFAMVVVLQAGGFIPLWFSPKATKYICLFFAIYLLLNTLLNISSKSKKEKYVMTPLSFIAAICFWMSANHM